MSDRILIPLPGIGTLALDRESYDAALREGSHLVAAPLRESGSTDEPLLGAEQLAEQLAIPVSWLEQKAREGIIPSLEFGRWRRYSRRAVEAAVAAGLQPSSTRRS